MLVKVQADKNANTPFARLGLKIEAMWDMSFLSRLNKLNLLNLNHSTMAFICPRSFCHKAHELNGPLRSFLLGIDIKTLRLKLGSLIEQEVVVMWLRLLFNFALADTLLGKVQFPSIHHFHHTHYFSRSFGRR
jgi:hypothetical protein